MGRAGNSRGVRCQVEAAKVGFDCQVGSVQAVRKALSQSINLPLLRHGIGQSVCMYRYPTPSRLLVQSGL